MRLDIFDWLGVWIVLTLFIMATRFLRSLGFAAGEAKALVYCAAQLSVLVAAYALFVRLARITEMLRPRLSKKALALLEECEKTGKVPEDDPALWDSDALLEPAPYAKLPEKEEHLGPDAVVRDVLRKLLGAQPPRNRHEQLFGALGRSGHSWMVFLVQYVFLGSTMLVAANLSAIEHEVCVLCVCVCVCVCVCEP